MKFSEIEKIAKNIRKTIGKQYGYKQCDYINYKILNGYFFCLNTLDTIDTKLEVKPLFIDDLYLSIIYPNRPKLRDSLRGTGILSHLCEVIRQERFPKNLKTDFSAQLYEDLITDVYRQADKSIASYLEKYPSPDQFGNFLANKNLNPTLTKILIAIRDGNIDLAEELAKNRLANGHGVTNVYSIYENGVYVKTKSEYEFILDYCSNLRALK